MIINCNYLIIYLYFPLIIFIIINGLLFYFYILLYKIYSLKLISRLKKLNLFLNKIILNLIVLAHIVIKLYPTTYLQIITLTKKIIKLKSKSFLND